MAGTGVGKFSSTASNNTSNLTVNFAENMAPSNVNNAARELMGHMRDMYEQLGDGYFEFGDGDGVYTIARVDADTLTIATAADLSTTYFAGRKIRVTDGGANVVEGTIASTSHGSSLQTVNLTGISLASGTPTKVELGIDTAAFGGKVILDDDGDTYIEAPTDDTIDIYVAGAKDFVITANTFTAESGSTITSPTVTASTSLKTPLIEFTDGDDAMTIADGGAVTFAQRDIHSSGITIANAGQIGSVGDADSIAIASDGVVTFSQAPVFPDGSIAVADLDIDGATDIGAAIVDADLFIIDDGAGGTNRKVTAARIKTYAGSSVGGTTGLDVNDSVKIRVGSGNDSELFFDGTNTILDHTSGSGSLFLRGDAIVLQDSQSTPLNYIDINQGAGVVFNEGSQDFDFRVESNDEANFFVIDGGNNVAGIGTTGSTVRFYIANANASNTSFLVQNTASDNSSVNADITAVRAANSAYSFYRYNSGNGSDVEFNFRGDGEGFVDGSFSGGGADYAEYFEWKDGNSSDEDRIGYAVILDGTQIVKATDSDDASKIIGVISGNPAVVGDSAWNKWQEKHVKDDWNRYTYEDYTQTEWKDEDDKIVTYQTDLIPSDVTVPDNAVVTSKDQNNDNLQRRVVNSNWDSTITYVPRSDRKEWDTVGLIGKLRLRKGQPTGTNWLKMRDISDTVEEWLVR